MAWSDSLEKANDAFGKKLQYYTGSSPVTMGMKFLSFSDEGLTINASVDGLFRIYSWDTMEGGTERFFDNVFQYKSSSKTISILDTPKEAGDNIIGYHKIYTFKVNDKTYYLCVYLTIGSSKNAGQGIRVFAIENNKLNDAVKIIKTKTGLHSELSFDYDFGSVVHSKVRPTIYFDVESKTINLPLVTANGTVTHSYIKYKFNGTYFERVLN
ncbi:MAG TPA: hypothetical protein VGN20_28465 [Mucilaginibacter sp.]|jgi:hypothetical protein